MTIYTHWMGRGVIPLYHLIRPHCGCIVLTPKWSKYKEKKCTRFILNTHGVCILFKGSRHTKFDAALLLNWTWMKKMNFKVINDFAFLFDSIGHNNHKCVWHLTPLVTKLSLYPLRYFFSTLTFTLNCLRMYHIITIFPVSLLFFKHLSLCTFLND